MRVTQQMLGNNMLNHLRNNLSRIDKIENQLSTTKRINRPSDDPVGVSYAMRYRSDLTANQQYQNNTDKALSWLDYMDTVVGQSVDVIQRANELAVKAANGTNTDQSLAAIASEIDELLAQLQEVANSQFNGQYVFNGQRTDKAPYPTDPPYNQPPTTDDQFDKGRIEYELSPGVVISVNFHGGEIFGGEDDDPDTNIFNVLHNLSNALKAEDQQEIENNLGRMSKGLDRMLEGWANLGAKMNRVQLIDNRLKDNNINTQTLLSKTEDVDVAAAITQMKIAENVYQASLASGARIIQPSLLDFLR